MGEFLYQLKSLLAFLLGHASPPDRGLRLRRLDPSDELLTFSWRLDSAVIAAAAIQKAPTFWEHHLWMRERIHGERHRTYVVLRGELPIGMVTITVQTPARCSLGYMVAPEFRGQGLAKWVRRLALNCIRGNMPEMRFLESRIRIDNARSIKTALRTGATLLGEPVDGFVSYEQALR